MNPLFQKRPPKNELELLERCQIIAGLSFSQLANKLGIFIPQNHLSRKGWLGMAVELALGAHSSNQALPDFWQLGVELKTLPLNKLGKSKESTFITSIPLLSLHEQEWLTSQCYAKLRRILWIPIEGDNGIPFEQRRIGSGFIWSPTHEQTLILQNDWQELTFLISSGQLNQVDSRQGQFLQVRPKASNAKSLCHAFDEEGNKVLTLPRGFYLRSLFTSEILYQHQNNL